MVTPVEDQQALLGEILEHWTKGAGSRSNPHRDKALSLVEGVRSVEEAIQRVTELAGQRPKVYGTAAAVSKSRLGIAFSAMAKSLDYEPALLLFGTGHGLSPELDALCDGFLPPLRRLSGYNHLSVRSAAAITLDRIFGERL